MGFCHSVPKRFADALSFYATYRLMTVSPIAASVARMLLFCRRVKTNPAPQMHFRSKLQQSRTAYKPSFLLLEGGER